ncbi:RNase A-like domain-containing protein [Acetobacter sp. DmW_125131]|uniref:RNase A-like domain-containing protein n=2 Tax=Acetobacteraceae TaxID=433 RepID=UPI001EE881EF|nr:RNase A-like domain-containing protein [Acetobacter sp. DmW_125131]
MVKRPVVSFFTSKEDVERAIHKMLKDNGPRIDRWFKNARDGKTTQFDGYTSERGTVVIENANRQRKAARHIQVTLIKKEHNGMSYYVQTVKLY